ncbi:MAG: UvrD-helicase domain-containing protein [Deltaproteobacteria bacterium]|nr:UvrD-helicase domain-containing protein [Deltaproteobacteria bacterium]
MSEFNESQSKVLASEKNLVVTAGAGSGKTHTLIEYIVKFIEKDPETRPITSILALTYTEKAAAEMKERLQEKVKKKLEGCQNTGDTVGRSLWERASRFLSQTEIGTIHSYALGLVTRHAHLIGLTENFSISDDQGEEIDELLADLIHEKNFDLLKILEVVPLSLDRSASLRGWLVRALALASSWGMNELRPKLENQENFTELTERIPRLSASLANDLAAIKNQSNTSRKWLEGAGLVNNIITTLPHSVDISNPFIVNRLTSLLDFFKGNCGGPEIKELKNSLIEDLNSLKTHYCADMSAVILSSFCSLTNLMIKRLREYRILNGLLSYDDMLYYAREILIKFPFVRKAERDKFSLVMIDEFQDTNRLQADIIALILAPETENNTTFGDLDFTAVPPKLKVIGDPKQSIYRFRGAEPAIMLELEKRLKNAGGDALTLDRNYRSQSGLISFFNGFFTTYLEEGYSIQFPERPNHYDTPHLALLLGNKDADKSKEQTLKIDRQLKLLTFYLKTLFDPNTEIKVADKKQNSDDEIPRPSRCGDVYILLRRKTNARAYQEALLKEGWPCHIVKSRNLYSLPEIRGLSAAYLYLAGRAPDYHLALLLGSPLGPVCNDTLTELSYPGVPKSELKFSNGLIPLSEWFKTPFKKFPAGIKEEDIQVLEDLRTLLNKVQKHVFRRSPGEIIEHILEERKLLPLIIGGPLGSPKRVKDVQFFLSQLKGRPLNDPASPFSSVDIVDQELRSLSSAEYEGDSDEDEDILAGEPSTGAINIMTVHKSKGLQSQVVIVPEADAKPSHDRGGIFISDAGEVALQFPVTGLEKSIQTSGYNTLQEENKIFSSAENKRLLYVASTRARDHLAFIGLTPGDSQLKKREENKQLLDERDKKSKKYTKADKGGVVKDLNGDESNNKLNYSDNGSWLGNLSVYPPIKDFAACHATGFTEEGEFTNPEMLEKDHFYRDDKNLLKKKEVVVNSFNYTDDFKNFDIQMVKSPPRGGHLSLSVTTYSILHSSLKDPNNTKSIESLLASIENSEMPAYLNASQPRASFGNLLPSERGTLFHSVMEVTDFSSDSEKIRELIQIKADELCYNPDDEDISFITYAFLDFLKSDIGQSVSLSFKENLPVFRELPVWVKLDEDEFGNGPIFLNGVIDLFFIEKSGDGYLVDYKLSSAHDNPSYDKQLDIYLTALRKTGFKNNIKTALWYPSRLEL